MIFTNGLSGVILSNCIPGWFSESWRFQVVIPLLRSLIKCQVFHVSCGLGFLTLAHTQRDLIKCIDHGACLCMPAERKMHTLLFLEITKNSAQFYAFTHEKAVWRKVRFVTLGKSGQNFHIFSVELKPQKSSLNNYSPFKYYVKMPGLNSR